jgi:hypothetical protein
MIGFAQSPRDGGASDMLQFENFCACHAKYASALVGEALGRTCVVVDHFDPAKRFGLGHAPPPPFPSQGRERSILPAEPYVCNGSNPALRLRPTDRLESALAAGV